MGGIRTIETVVSILALSSWIISLVAIVIVLHSGVVDICVTRNETLLDIIGRATYYCTIRTTCGDNLVVWV